MNPDYPPPPQPVQPASSAPPQPPELPPPMPPTSEPPAMNYKQNPLSVMQPGEQMVCEIKRHPFGLFSTYAGVGVLIIALIAVVALVPHYAPNLSSHAKLLIMAVGFIAIVVALLFAYISTYIYKNNRWIVTSDSITQVSQVGLFRKQSSQLSLANLEDVTAEQSGLLQSMLNFGGLRVETAGERSKFFFSFCPNPNYYAREILACREAFIRNQPEAAKRGNDLLNVPQYPAS